MRSQKFFLGTAAAAGPAVRPAGTVAAGTADGSDGVGRSTVEVVRGFAGVVRGFAGLRAADFLVVRRLVVVRPAGFFLVAVRFFAGLRAAGFLVVRRLVVVRAVDLRRTARLAGRRFADFRFAGMRAAVDRRFAGLRAAARLVAPLRFVVVELRRFARRFAGMRCLPQ